MSESNIDQQELDKFAAMASNWWDLAGECKPLHQINPLRLAYIQQRANGIFGKKILDVGCGGGILTESMAQEGAFVTGLDMGTEALHVARLHAIETGVPVDYLQETVEQHAKQYPGSYDLVTCMEMLEHVPDPRSVVLACARLVKPGGEVFFSTINRNAKAWLMLIIGAEYLTKMLPKGTHNAKKFIRPSELIQWLDESAFHTQHMIGIHYNPLIDRFRLGMNVDANYMLHAVQNDTA